MLYRTLEGSVSYLSLLSWGFHFRYWRWNRLLFLSDSRKLFLSCLRRWSHLLRRRTFHRWPRGEGSSLELSRWSLPGNRAHLGLRFESIKSCKLSWTFIYNHDHFSLNWTNWKVSQSISKYFCKDQRPPQTRNQTCLSLSTPRPRSF